VRRFNHVAGEVFSILLRKLGTLTEPTN